MSVKKVIVLVVLAVFLLGGLWIVISGLVDSVNESGSKMKHFSAGAEELRGVPHYSVLSFSSRNDLDSFFKNHEFYYGQVSNLVWSVSVTINKKSLCWESGGVWHYVIVPMLVKDKNTGDTEAILPSTSIYISNLPNKTEVDIVGFKNSNIQLNNVAGRVLIGGHVELSLNTTASVAWVISFTVHTSSGVTGNSNVGITAMDCNRVVVASYVGDSSNSPLMSFNRVNYLRFSAVSIFYYSPTQKNAVGGYGVLITNVHNFVISNGLGVVENQYGVTNDMVFGFYSAGYSKPILLSDVDNFWVNGTFQSGGWSTHSKSEYGLFAYNVKHFHVLSSSDFAVYNAVPSTINLYFTMKYLVSYKSGAMMPTAYYLGGKFTSIQAFFSDYSHQGFGFQAKLNLDADYFSREWKSNIGNRMVRSGFRLSNMSWGGWAPCDGVPKIDWLNESYVGKNYPYVVAWHSNITSRTFTSQLFKNVPVSGNSVKNGKIDSISFIFDSVDSSTGYEKIVLALENVDVNKSEVTKNNITWNNETLTWTGFVGAKAYITASIRSMASVTVKDSKYALAVGDNGSKESQLVRFFNNTTSSSAVAPTLIHVDEKIEYNIRQAGAPIDVLFPYLGLSGFLTFLVAFAFVRWAYGMIISGDSPEEVAKNKQLLKQILIGGVIVFFVMYNFGVILNIFQFP